MVRTWTALLFAVALAAPALLAQQPPPPLPPEVGNAVLLATHSIQVDRDTVVTRGDLVVNEAGPAPWLGERELSLDQNVRTPLGFSVKGNGVDIDGGAVVGGDVVCNVVQNAGTVQGQIRTPLVLPVISQLPALIDRPSGTQNVTVDNGQTQILGTGDYADLVVKRDGTLHLGGGPYTFASITTDRGATIVWDGPGEVVVNGAIAFGQNTTIAAAPGLSTKHKMFFAHAGVSIGKECNIAATFLAPNGTIDASDSLVFTGSLVGRDIHIGRGSTLTLRSGFRNLPPVANSQTVTVTSSDPVVITLTGSDPDLDPLRFAIGLPPTNGTLSPIVPSGPTSAVVVYTPSVARPNDVFTFRVIDSENFGAEGVVTINEGLALPGPPTTIMAADDLVEVPPDRPSIIILRAIGPQGVPITVSIVAGSGPTFGTLGPLQQQQQNPFRPAQVPYVPNPGFIGEDSFQFEACGVIDGAQVCATATIRIAVLGTEPAELAPDRTETATSGAALPIVLATTPGPAAFDILSLPQDGTLTDSNGVPISSVPYRLPSGIVSYRSTAGFTGTVSFDYRVTAGGPQPQTDTGTVTINVQPAPGNETGGDLAPDITVTVASGSPITFSVASAGGATAYRVLSLPSPGTLRDSTGAAITSTPYTLPSPELTFQSASGFTGTLSFAYSVNAGPQSDTGVVTIVVTAGDDNGR
jgi:Bacterial Ig domain